MKLSEGSFSFGGRVAYCPQTAWIQNATLVRSVAYHSSPNVDNSAEGQCGLWTTFRRGQVLERHGKCVYGTRSPNVTRWRLD